MNEHQRSQRTMVMVPAYNEIATVGTVVNKLKELGQGYDILVIDDGSKDGTGPSARNSGADVVTLPFHCGGTWAVIAGYRLAIQGGYKYLVKVDADGQHRVSDVTRLLSALENGQDVVVGSRYLSSDELDSQRDSLTKHWGRLATSTLVSTASGMKITDVTSGLRAWRCEVLKVLLENYEKNGYAHDSVFWLNETILLKKLERKIMEVPVSIDPRLHGTSKSFTRIKMLNFPVRAITTLLRSLFWR